MDPLKNAAKQIGKTPEETLERARKMAELWLHEPLVRYLMISVAAFASGKSNETIEAAKKIISELDKERQETVNGTTTYRDIMPIRIPIKEANNVVLAIYYQVVPDDYRLSFDMDERYKNHAENAFRALNETLPQYWLLLMKGPIGEIVSRASQLLGVNLGALEAEDISFRVVKFGKKLSIKMEYLEEK